MSLPELFVPEIGRPSTKGVLYSLGCGQADRRALEQSDCLLILVKEINANK